MQSNGRNSSTSTQRRSRRNRPRQSVLARDLHGAKLTMPLNPPDVNVQPWNTVTLAFQTKPGDQKVSDIWDNLLEHFDRDGLDAALSPTFSIPRELWGKNLKFTSNGVESTVRFPKTPVGQFRIHSIKVWNLSGRTIALTVYDHSASRTIAGNQIQTAVNSLVDSGGPETFPRVGFQFPSHMSSHIIRSDDEKGMAFLSCNLSASTSTDILMVYIRVDWKTTSRVFAPVTARDSFGVLSSVDNSLSEHRRLLEEIRANQPGTVSKIVNGVTAVAAYVAPIVGAESISLSELNKLKSMVSDLERFSVIDNDS